MIHSFVIFYIYILYLQYIPIISNEWCGIDFIDSHIYTYSHYCIHECGKPNAMNHPQVITIFMGAMFTIVDHPQMLVFYVYDIGIYGSGSKPWYLVNIKIAGKWMFIPLKMVLIGIDPYPYIGIMYWVSSELLVGAPQYICSSLQHTSPGLGAPLLARHALASMFIDGRQASTVAHETLEPADASAQKVDASTVAFLFGPM